MVALLASETDGKLLMAAVMGVSARIGSPLSDGGGVGVSVVVATDKASPSSESKRSAGGPSLKPQVGLDMVDDVTACKVVKEVGLVGHGFDPDTIDL